MGYSYFRKPVSEMQGEEEHIFCDDESKMEMIERVIKGRMLPLVIIFFCVIIPQLLLQSRLTHPLNQTIFVIYIFLFLVYVVLFIQFATTVHHIAISFFLLVAFQRILDPSIGFFYYFELFLYVFQQYF